jgi:hypothetical protein
MRGAWSAAQEATGEALNREFREVLAFALGDAALPM